MLFLYRMIWATLFLHPVKGIGKIDVECIKKRCSKTFLLHLFFVDMLMSCINSIYFSYDKFDIILQAKFRYDINLVAERQHIECRSTYRVLKDISKISQEIYIEAKCLLRHFAVFTSRHLTSSKVLT